MKMCGTNWIVVLLAWLSAVIFLNVHGSVDPTGVACFAVNSTTLNISWSQATDLSVAGYHLSIYRTDGLIIEIPIPPLDMPARDYETYTFYGLGKYALYNVSIHSYFTSGSNSTDYSLDCMTAADVPDATSFNFSCEGISYTEIYCEWENLSMSYRNGLLQGYQLQHILYKNAEYVFLNVTADTLNYTVNGLDFDTHYILQLRAINNVGLGPYTSAKAKTLGWPEVNETLTRYFCYEALPGRYEIPWYEMPCSIYVAIIAFFMVLSLLLLICLCCSCCCKGSSKTNSSTNINIVNEGDQYEGYDDDYDDETEESEYEETTMIMTKTTYEEGSSYEEDESSYDEDEDDPKKAKKKKNKNNKMLTARDIKVKGLKKDSEDDNDDDEEDEESDEEEDDEEDGDTESDDEMNAEDEAILSKNEKDLDGDELIAFKAAQARQEDKMKRKNERKMEKEKKAQKKKEKNDAKRKEKEIKKNERKQQKDKKALEKKAKDQEKAKQRLQRNGDKRKMMEKMREAAGGKETERSEKQKKAVIASKGKPDKSKVTVKSSKNRRKGVETDSDDDEDTDYYEDWNPDADKNPDINVEKINAGEDSKGNKAAMKGRSSKGNKESTRKKGKSVNKGKRDDHNKNSTNAENTDDSDSKSYDNSDSDESSHDSGQDKRNDDRENTTSRHKHNKKTKRLGTDSGRGTSSSNKSDLEEATSKQKDSGSRKKDQMDNNSSDQGANSKKSVGGKGGKSKRSGDGTNKLQGKSDSIANNNHEHSSAYSESEDDDHEELNNSSTLPYSKGVHMSNGETDRNTANHTSNDSQRNGPRDRQAEQNKSNQSDSNGKNEKAKKPGFFSKLFGTTAADKSSKSNTQSNTKGIDPSNGKNSANTAKTNSKSGKNGAPYNSQNGNTRNNGNADDISYNSDWDDGPATANSFSEGGPNFANDGNTANNNNNSGSTLSNILGIGGRATGGNSNYNNNPKSDGSHSWNSPNYDLQSPGHGHLSLNGENPSVLQSGKFKTPYIQGQSLLQNGQVTNPNKGFGHSQNSNGLPHNLQQHPHEHPSKQGNSKVSTGAKYMSGIGNGTTFQGNGSGIDSYGAGVNGPYGHEGKYNAYGGKNTGMKTNPYEPHLGNDQRNSANNPFFGNNIGSYEDDPVFGKGGQAKAVGIRGHADPAANTTSNGMNSGQGKTDENGMFGNPNGVSKHNNTGINGSDNGNGILVNPISNNSDGNKMDRNGHDSDKRNGNGINGYSNGSNVQNVNGLNGYGNGSNAQNGNRTNGYGNGANVQNGNRTNGYGDGANVQNGNRTNGYGDGANVQNGNRTNGYGDGANVQNGNRTNGYGDGANVQNRNRTNGYGDGANVQNGNRTNGYGYGANVQNGNRTNGNGDGANVQNGNRTNGYGDGANVQNGNRTNGYGNGANVQNGNRTNGYGNGANVQNGNRTNGYGDGANVQNGNRINGNGNGSFAPHNNTMNGNGNGYTAQNGKPVNGNGDGSNPQYDNVPVSNGRNNNGFGTATDVSQGDRNGTNHQGNGIRRNNGSEKEPNHYGANLNNNFGNPLDEGTDQKQNGNYHDAHTGNLNDPQMQGGMANGTNTSKFSTSGQNPAGTYSSNPGTMSQMHAPNGRKALSLNGIDKETRPGHFNGIPSKSRKPFQSGNDLHDYEPTNHQQNAQQLNTQGPWNQPNNSFGLNPSDQSFQYVNEKDPTDQGQNLPKHKTQNQKQGIPHGTQYNGVHQPTDSHPHLYNNPNQAGAPDPLSTHLDPSQNGQAHGHNGQYPGISGPLNPQQYTGDNPLGSNIPNGGRHQKPAKAVQFRTNPSEGQPARKMSTSDGAQNGIYPASDLRDPRRNNIRDDHDNTSLQGYELPNDSKPSGPGFAKRLNGNRQSPAWGPSKKGSSNPGKPGGTRTPVKALTNPQDRLPVTEPEPMIGSDRIGSKFPFLKANKDRYRRNSSDTSAAEPQPNTSNGMRKNKSEPSFSKDGKGIFQLPIQTKSTLDIPEPSTSGTDNGGNNGGGMMIDNRDKVFYGFGVGKWRLMAVKWLNKFKMKKKPVKTASSDWD